MKKDALKDRMISAEQNWSHGIKLVTSDHVKLLYEDQHDRHHARHITVPSQMEHHMHIAYDKLTYKLGFHLHTHRNTKGITSIELMISSEKMEYEKKMCCLLA